MKKVILLLSFTVIVTTAFSQTNKLMEKVTFNNKNLNMAGILHLPENMEQGKKYPAIIFIHPGGGVKEQTAGLYASKMAQKGFIGLAFDASYQGESEGEPRFLEDPNARVEDARCAVDFLTTLPFVDIEKIGAVGICAGGGYAVSVTQTERRIKAVAGISAVNVGDAYRKGWTGDATIEEQIKSLEDVARQRTAEANGADIAYFGYVPDVIDENTAPSLVEGYDYYRTPRAQHPNSKNLIMLTSLDRLYAFDAFANISIYLTQPLLMIVGSEAVDSRWHSERAVKETAGPKELMVVEGATHVSLYDRPQYVEPIVEKLTGFFGENLK